MKNKLINETSPYLLQHAANPVHWYPYGSEALNKAQEENKLLIISIGYFACHWCHVMEHESFENEEVAQVMNSFFISVKIDREERPDLDNYYMDAVHLLNQRGGWPLNCIALPDGRPIWGGTYFKPKQWIGVLNEIVRIFTHEPHLLLEQAQIINNKLLEVNQLTAQKHAVSLEPLTALNSSLESYLSYCDKQLGGFSGAPKFPMPTSFQFLLRMAYQFWREDVKEVIHTTLSHMARGGIYDQIGGGFSRYSTDEFWKVPHFEKMLYDNAQLISLYSEAFRMSPNPEYQKVIQETISFLKRDLCSAEGLYFASLDADSEGEEGKHYIWTYNELFDILGKDADVLCDYFGVDKKGNWEHRKNILLRTHNVDYVMLKHDISEETLQEIIQRACAILLENRQKRTMPPLDYKVIVSWNALLLTGFLDAYKATGNNHYLEDALALGQKIQQSFLAESGQLIHCIAKGKPGNEGFLDDYALLALAYIDLAQTTQQMYWLNLVEGMLTYVIPHFLDQSTGMFFYTSINQVDINIRKIEYYDTVMPSSNAALCMAFIRYGRIREDNRFLEFASIMINRMQSEIPKQPTAFGCWLIALYEFKFGEFSLKVNGPEKLAMLKSFYLGFNPNVYTMLTDNPGDNSPDREVTKAYVCSGDACFAPVQSVDQLILLTQPHKV